MKYLYHTFLLLLVFCSSNIHSQQYYDLPNTLKENSRSIKDVFTLTNKKSSNLNVFIDDKKGLNAYIYNTDLEIISQLASDGLANRYNEIIGYTQQEGKTALFLSHRNHKKFGAVIFDFENQKTKEIKFPIKLKKERYLQTLSRDDKLYIITVLKNTSTFKIYTFEGTKLSKHIIAAEGNFRIKYNQPKDLYGMMVENDMMASRFDFEKIEADIPISIEMASAYAKLYETEAGFDLTLDRGIFETFILSVDLNNYKATVENYEKPKYSSNHTYYSNSFLLEDKLYQLVANSKELYFQVKNKNTKEVLKDISLTRDDDIDFKNTPIVQDKEGDLFAPHRELEKTSKFLRKINNDNIGVSVRKENDNYIIDMGSYTEVKGYYAAPAMMGGGLPGTGGFGFGGVNMFIGAYASYGASRAVKIQCLFDENFIHQQGGIQPNVFDKINKFTEDLKNNDIAESVFEWNDKIYYAYYNKDTEAYRITEFSK